MNTEQMILAYLKEHPGLTASELAKGMKANVRTVREAGKTLVTMGEVYLDMKFRYYLVEEATAVDAEYARLSKLAMSLQARNCWSRAATVWLNAMDATAKPRFRDQAVARRRMCMQKAKASRPKPSADAWGGI
ncbi:PerC family transcriptional regulator [Pantoea piersonii]|uniref:PerC family transcriptional regulator n=1 Tax=Pantoea piersonii TaxID=2364647 RepID=UPI002FD97E3B